MSENNQIQADVNEVIQHLSNEVAQLTQEKAVLSSLVNRYQQKMSELEQNNDE